MANDTNYINDKCLETLEYNKIIEILMTKASSNAGKELCKKLLPSSDKKVIDKSIEETDAALSYLWKTGPTPSIFASENDEKSIPGKQLSEGFHETVNISNNN